MKQPKKNKKKSFDAEEKIPPEKKMKKDPNISKELSTNLPPTIQYDLPASSTTSTIEPEKSATSTVNAPGLGLKLKIKLGKPTATSTSTEKSEEDLSSFHPPAVTPKIEPDLPLFDLFFFSLPLHWTSSDHLDRKPPH